MQTLKRNLGILALSAIGMNITVGVGVFALPSAFINGVGTTWAPLLVLFVGLALVPIGLCFAELGSRFKETGGPYIYVRTAFGATPGFIVGWLLWITRIVSHASVLVVLVTVLRPLGDDYIDGRVFTFLVATGVTGILCWMNLRGNDVGIRSLLFLSVLKFTPLIALIVIGVPTALFETSALAQSVNEPSWARTGILIAFGLSGFEMLTVMGGEAKDPDKTIPRALLLSLFLAVFLMATLTYLTGLFVENAARSEQPLVDLASVLFGVTGATLISGAIIFSVLGHNASSLIASSRIIYALGKQSDLPNVLALLDKKKNVPYVAIIICSIVIVLLAVSGSYLFLASLGGITRILIYLMVAAATLRLRNKRFDDVLPGHHFKAPFGILGPCLAMLACVFLITGTPLGSAITITVAVGAGLLVYFLHKNQSLSQSSSTENRER